MPEGTGIGAAVRRKEDNRFLTGKGRYTDDINRPGQAYAYFLRSPHARAAPPAIGAPGKAYRLLIPQVAPAIKSEIAHNKRSRVEPRWVRD